MTMQKSIINFDVQVHLADRGGRWAAYIEPPGMTVYGATEDAVNARVREALNFFLKHFNNDATGGRKLRQYLDAHRVPHFVTTEEPASTIRLRRPVSLPMGVAANA